MNPLTMELFNKGLNSTNNVAQALQAGQTKEVSGGSEGRGSFADTFSRHLDKARTEQASTKAPEPSADAAKSAPRKVERAAETEKPKEQKEPAAPDEEKRSAPAEETRRTAKGEERGKGEAKRSKEEKPEEQADAGPPPLWLDLLNAPADPIRLPAGGGEALPAAGEGGGEALPQALERLRPTTATATAEAADEQVATARLPSDKAVAASADGAKGQGAGDGRDAASRLLDSIKPEVTAKAEGTEGESHTPFQQLLTTAAGGARATATPTAPAGATAQTQPGIDVPLRQAGWSDALGNRVVWMVNDKASSAELRLNPAHLGPMEVRISFNNDQAHVTMVSQHAQVREALDAAVPRLREMMAEQGINLGDVNISHQAPQQHGNHAGGAGGDGNRGGGGGGGSAGAEADAGQTVAETSPEGGGAVLDLFA